MSNLLTSALEKWSGCRGWPERARSGPSNGHRRSGFGAELTLDHVGRSDGFPLQASWWSFPPKWRAKESSWCGAQVGSDAEGSEPRSVSTKDRVAVWSHVFASSDMPSCQ